METKQMLSLFLIAGFLGTAVFGVWAMHPLSISEARDEAKPQRAQGGHSSSCLAAISKGSPCLAGKDVFASLIFHVSAFKNFSTAIFAVSILAFLLLLVALAFVSTFIAGPIVNFAQSFQTRQLSEQPTFQYQRKFTHWLALLENSPNFS